VTGVWRLAFCFGMVGALPFHQPAVHFIIAPLRDFDFSFDYDIFFRLLRAVHFIIVPLGLSGKIATALCNLFRTGTLSFSAVFFLHAQVSRRYGCVCT